MSLIATGCYLDLLDAMRFLGNYIPYNERFSPGAIRTCLTALLAKARKKIGNVTQHESQTVYP